MKYGTIKCECGKEFYFETVRNTVNCIGCGKEWDALEYPELEEEENSEGETR